MKYCTFPGYNWIFNPENGQFIRWGQTINEDPTFSPLGSELLDIEISTKCSQSCRHCYKSNIPGKYDNMSLATYQTILPKLLTTKNLFQVAFGIGDIDGHPEMYDIFDYTRSQGVVPNLTINGFRMRADDYRRLANVLGACSVSHYSDDSCFNAVAQLKEAGLRQVNIHQLLSLETYENCIDLINKTKTDSRLAGLGAIVFLTLKPKGRGQSYHSIPSMNEYKKLLRYAIDNEVRIGMDSCNAPMFLRAMEELNLKNPLTIASVEPCESGLFSLYIDVSGIAWPCSFAEGVSGIPSWDMLQVDDFLEDVWFSDGMKEWRNRLLSSSKTCSCEWNNGQCRSCPIYNISLCKTGG